MTCVYGTGWSQSNSSCVDAALVDCDYQEEKQGRRGAYQWRIQEFQNGGGGRGPGAVDF